MKVIYPETQHGIVGRMDGSLFPYQGWPTVARDEKGTLYAVASGFRVQHVCPFGKTVMYISRDEGATWSPPIVINDSILDDRDAGIVYLGEGRLLVSWFTRSAEEYQTPKYEALMARAHPVSLETAMGTMAGYRHLTEAEKKIGSYVRLSRDYGMTWEEPTALPVTAPHGPAVCRDGSLVYLGMEHRAVGADRKPPVQLFRSEDLGKTWHCVSTVTPPDWLAPGEGLEEPHVLELPDGRLLGAFRVEGRKPLTIATAFSSDGGRSWGPVSCARVNGAPPHLMRHSSGALICTYGRREQPYGQRAMVSHDLGETWEEEYVLDICEESLDLGYGSTVELDDGSLLSVYYQRYPGDKFCSILYTRWRLLGK